MKAGIEEMAKLMNRLPELIAEWEKQNKRRLSLSQLARDAKVSRDTLSRMYTREEIGISSQTIVNICKFFRKQPGDLLYIEYEPGELD